MGVVACAWARALIKYRECVVLLFVLANQIYTETTAFYTNEREKTEKLNDDRCSTSTNTSNRTNHQHTHKTQPEQRWSSIEPENPINFSNSLTIVLKTRTEENKKIISFSNLLPKQVDWLISNARFHTETQDGTSSTRWGFEAVRSMKWFWFLIFQPINKAKQTDSTFFLRVKYLFKRVETPSGYVVYLEI